MSDSKSYIEIRTDGEMADFRGRIASGCQNLAVGIDTLAVYRNPKELNKILLAPQGLPVAFIYYKQLGEQGRDVVAQLLSEKAMKKIAHDWCSLGPRLRSAGLAIGGKYFDVKIAAQLRNAGLEGYDFSLENLIQWYLQQELPTDLKERLARSILALIPLEKILTNRLKKADLLNVTEIEFACIPAVVEMQFHGMAVDRRKLESARVELIRLFRKAEDKLLHLLGVDINVNNSGQLLDALNDSAELGRSGLWLENTQKKTLQQHANEHRVIRAVLDYRGVKSKGEAVRACLDHIDPETKRIHPTYDPMGTVTGRFSCKEPAIQAMPRGLRSYFVAGRGRKLVIADYSQVELRIAAAISQDQRMIEAFQSGQDFHSLTASIILGIPVNRVTESQRKAAKAVNFGILFGMGPQGVCDYANSNLGERITIAQAERFQNAFFDAYPELDAWCQDQMDRELWWAKEDKVWQTRTMCNRLRLWEDAPEGPELVNTPIQGTAADILKIALGKAVRRFEGMDAKIIACVHDEIVVETDREIATTVRDELEDIMKTAASQLLAPVPVEVDLTISDSWLP